MEPQQLAEYVHIPTQPRRPAILQRAPPLPHPHPHPMPQPQPQPQAHPLAGDSSEDHNIPDLISLNMPTPLVLLGGEQLPLLRGGAVGAGATVGGEVLPPGQWPEPQAPVHPENIGEMELSEQVEGLDGE